MNTAEPFLDTALPRCGVCGNGMRRPLERADGLKCHAGCMPKVNRLCARCGRIIGQKGIVTKEDVWYHPRCLSQTGCIELSDFCWLCGAELDRAAQALQPAQVRVGCGTWRYCMACLMEIKRVDDTQGA